MNLSLRGKRALVSGSSQGIGKEIAMELASLGAECFLLARSEDHLKKVSEGLSTEFGQNHSFLSVDFSSAHELKSALPKMLEGGSFHILINNTGGPKGGEAVQADPSEFQEAFVRHLVGNQILVQGLVEGMKNENYGRVINIISTSVREPIPGLGVSNTIRGAVASWAKTISRELGPSGITVNNILPGFTDTGRLRELFESKAKKLNVSLQDVKKDAISKIPLGRLADPKEIAVVAAFLASPAASYISGQSIAVDGGRLLSI